MRGRARGPAATAPSQPRDETVSEVSEVSARGRRGAGFAPPTRRLFLALVLATGAGALVKPPAAPAKRSTWAGKTRWIGHC